MAMRTNYFIIKSFYFIFFFFQAEDGIRDGTVTGVQTCALPISAFDARFPTVKSPNPENAEALALGVALAETEKLDVVMATDPDADRMGVAVRNKAGQMEFLTGNQEIGRASCRERV